MAEAYALIEERLHLSVEEQYSLENQIMELKVCDAFSDKVCNFKKICNMLMTMQAEVRKRERDLNALKQECSDLQYQVMIFLEVISIYVLPDSKKDVVFHFPVIGNFHLNSKNFTMMHLYFLLFQLEYQERL